MTPFASLRFEGLAGLWGAFWLTLVVAGAAFLVWTYRGIYLRSGKGFTWWLFAMRALGLLFLALMLAKPTWTAAAAHDERGQVAVVLDTSRSMTLPDAGGRPRYERAKEALAALTKKVSAGRDPLDVVLFDVAGNRLSEVPAEAKGDFTDLDGAVRKAATRLRSRPLSGVVLISDGVDTTGRTDFGSWEGGGVTVHTVGFPAGVEFDLAVRKPPEVAPVLVHNEARIQVPVVKRGKTEIEASVVLRRGREELARKAVKLGAGDVEEVVTLAYKPDEVGQFELTAAVEGPANEVDTGNNAANVDLRVIKDPIRVLYLEGFLRNEYTFLVRHFVERDPDVQLAARPRRTAADGPEPTLPDGFLDEKVLDKTDIVILGDMEGDYLTDAQQKTLVKWLEGKSRSLIVLGGYASFGGKGFRGRPLADVLPVVFSDDADPQSEKPFSLELTEKGKAHPIFQVSADRVKNEALWKEAPPLEGMPLVAKEKPGADVLAVNPAVEVGGKPAVALAVQRAPGGGQVMVLCPDSTWTWSRLPRVLGREDDLYSRFWSQTVRWCLGRSMDDNRPLLAVRTERAVHDVKQKVSVTLVRQRRPGADAVGTTLKVEILDPKGAAVPGLEVRPDATKPEESRVEFYPNLAGRYEVDASLSADGKTVANVAGELRVRGADLELAQAATRPETLRSLARATGGLAVSVEDMDEVAGRLERVGRSRVRVTRTEYWNVPALFLGFVAAVSLEWLLRRRYNLV